MHIGADGEETRVWGDAGYQDIHKRDESAPANYTTSIPTPT